MTLTQEQITAREEVLSDCPPIVIYGPSGVGKTTFLGPLLGDERYQHTLYIDGDRGATTIQKFVKQPELCVHHTPDKNVVNAFTYLNWLRREIDNADKVTVDGGEIRAIVVEGLSRVYAELAAEMMDGCDEATLKGPSLMQMFAPGAQMFKALVSKVSNLQQRLRRAGRSVPIIMTMNTKVKFDDSYKMFHLPEVSDNGTLHLMRGCDVFVQLDRTGTNVRIKTDRDSNNPFRKVRGTLAAQKLAKLGKPDAVTMIQTWADALALEKSKITEKINSQQE